MKTKIEVIARGKVYKNTISKFGYAAWPSITKDDDGNLLVTSSGMRMRHVDPFGKVVLFKSRDNGKTWSAPSVIIDTPLDDRDAGILNIGNGVFIVTTFNNTREMQRTWIKNRNYVSEEETAKTKMMTGYLDLISDNDEKKYHCASINISTNNAQSFDKMIKFPVTAPHGPIKTPSGKILFVGKTHDLMHVPEGGIFSYVINDDFTFDKIGTVIRDFEAIKKHAEPHALALSDDHILLHIRTEGGCFTIYQCESFDGGKTWTKLRDLGCDGSPPHLLKHSGGKIISVYGKRTTPYGISAMISSDEGKNWDIDIPLTRDGIDTDLGYPASVELPDGSIYTVYYGKENPGELNGIYYINWRI